MPETTESPARTITLGIFYVIVGDVLLAILIGMLSAIMLGFSPSFGLLPIAAWNTGIVGWLWVVPVTLRLHHKRPLLVRVMIFTSAVLTLLNAACFGLLFYGGLRG